MGGARLMMTMRGESPRMVISLPALVESYCRSGPKGVLEIRAIGLIRHPQPFVSCEIFAPGRECAMASPRQVERIDDAARFLADRKSTRLNSSHIPLSRM